MKRGLAMANDKLNWLDYLEIAAAMMPFVAIGVAIYGLHPTDQIPEPPPSELSESINEVETLGDRSPAWSRVRAEFVAEHSVCEACGSREKLNVHHIQPFHLHPELELELSNLITLCFEHHFRVGHDPDGPWQPKKPKWTAWNPAVRQHAQQMRAKAR
jgi:hypothetical protein